jgi:hypothetical protein
MSEGFNKNYINKAAVITPGSFANSQNNMLSKDEADKFIDYVVDQSFMKKNARVERMNTPTKTIAKVGIGNKILKPAKSAVDPGNTVSFETDQLTLTTKEIIAVAEISDDSLEDNIEGDAFVDHLMKMIASQAANELDMMCMYGKRLPDAEISNATDINQLVNGWMTLASGSDGSARKDSSHVIDARTSGLFKHADGSIDTDGFITPDKLSRVVKTLPNKYRGNKQNLRFLIADDIYQDYNDYLGARTVATADPYLLGVGNLTYSNIPLQSVSLMPTDRPVIKIGGANTTISGGVMAGATSFVLADVTGVSNGDYLTLGYGTPYEETVCVSGIAGNTVSISGKLMYGHLSGDTAKEVTPDGTDMLLTDYRNLIFGIQRDIRWETERHARRRSTSFVMTLRVDTQIENLDSMVLLKGLKVK